MDGTRPDGGVFYADERTVYVSFPGRLGEIETDYCSGQYEMVAEETATDVSVTVFRILPAVQPAETPCDASLTYALMSVDLDEPLGDRTLTTGSIVVNPAFVNQRLMPMWVPDHWQAQEGPCHSVGSCWLRFGQVSVEIQAMADKPGVGIVRGNPLHEDVSIRGVDDGAVVTRASTGVHRLGFDDAGWFYDFIAQPGVDRDVLIEFAQRFDHPGGALARLPEPSTEAISQVQSALGLDDDAARTYAQLQTLAMSVRPTLRRMDTGYLALVVDGEGLAYTSKGDPELIDELFDRDIRGLVTVEQSEFSELDLMAQVRTASTLARDSGFDPGEFTVNSSKFPTEVSILLSADAVDVSSRAALIEQSTTDLGGPPITVTVGEVLERLQEQ